MPKFRVLSLDGGGIRGLVTAIILQRILGTRGLETFLDKIDLVAGTSTGGLLALAIAHGVSLDTICRLYKEKGQKVFDDSWLDDLVDLGGLCGANYSIAPLRRELRAIFGNATLGDLKKHVLITAFDLDFEDTETKKRMWKPKLFHNIPGPEDDRPASVVSVGLYTSAAPTYFPSVDGFIDGGVYAPNPAMCALAQTQDQRYYKPPPALHNIVLLSLGTGTNLQYIKGDSLDWGYAQWAKPLVNLMLDGTSGIADYQCRQLLNERYHRLAPEFPPGTTVAMDEYRKIPAMEALAYTEDLRKTIKWIKQYWMTD